MMRLILLLLISSCALFWGRDRGPVSAKDKHYRVKFNQPAWRQRADERSDYVFANEQDGRIMLSNSFCNEFQDQPLEQLAGRTFETLSEFESIQGDYLQFSNREAYRMRGVGRVDGVKVNLQLLNTRRNNCYFDFVAIDPFSLSQGHHQDFEHFLNSVEFR
jgi:hypothetical protein